MQATGLTRYINSMTEDERLKALELLQVKLAVQQLSGKPIPQHLVQLATARLQHLQTPVPSGYSSKHRRLNGPVEVRHVAGI